VGRNTKASFIAKIRFMDVAETRHPTSGRAWRRYRERSAFWELKASSAGEAKAVMEQMVRCPEDLEKIFAGSQFFPYPDEIISVSIYQEAP